MNRTLFMSVLGLSLLIGACGDVITSGPLSNTPISSDISSDQLEGITKFKHQQRLTDRGIHVIDTEKEGNSGLLDTYSIESTSSSEQDSLDLIVAYNDTTEVDADKMMRRYKMLRRYEFTSAFRGVAVSMHVDDFAASLLDMQNDPDIAWFELDMILNLVQIDLSPSSLLPFQEVPWGITDVGANESSAASGNHSGSVSGVNLYIIDTGASPYDNNVGLRLENYSSSLVGSDAYGHGVHVVSTAAGSDNLLGYVGVAPGVKTWSLKALDDFGSGTMASVIAALDRVAQIHASENVPGVVNLSLGAYIGTREYTALDHAVDQLVDAGLVVVVAAGNDRVNADYVTPAHAKNVITVGAYDAAHQFASFSNYGTSVDLLAPGVDILGVGQLDPLLNGSVMSGTSMAAPHVAGAAALYLSQNPSANPARVRKALITQSRPIVSQLRKGTRNRALWVGNF